MSFRWLTTYGLKSKIAPSLSVVVAQGRKRAETPRFKRTWSAPEAGGDEADHRFTFCGATRQVESLVVKGET